MSFWRRKVKGLKVYVKQGSAGHWRWFIGEPSGAAGRLGATWALCPVQGYPTDEAAKRAATALLTRLGARDIEYRIEAD